MICKAYKNITPEHNWKLIYDGDTDKQFEIADNIKKIQRQRRRKKLWTMRPKTFGHQGSS